MKGTMEKANAEQLKVLEQAEGIITVAAGHVTGELTWL